LILPDINVLVYAFRKDCEGHARYRAWLNDVVNGDAAYGMSPQVLSGLLRIATHPRIFAQPSGVEETLEFAAVLLKQPHCRIVQPGPEHWRIFGDLCRSAHASGNLVQDAWLAALAIESGCQWITTDRDFARFHGLRWAPPF
jgi:toxin-antitoxin system PIN domain toxin